MYGTKALIMGTYLEEGLELPPLFQSPIRPTLGRSEERAQFEELTGAPPRVRGALLSSSLLPDIADTKWMKRVKVDDASLNSYRQLP